MTHKFGKYLILAVGALGLSALPALADSACPSVDLGPTYLAPGFSCYVTYNGVTLDFSNFTYTPGGSVTDPATSIGVSPAPPPGNDGPGLNFNPAIDISNGATEDVKVGFTVTDLTPGTLIDDVYIALTAPVFEGNGGDINYSENICSSAGCLLYVDDMNVFGQSLSTSVNLSQTAVGGPVSSLTITKDVQVSTNAGGTVLLSGFTNEYSTVPEPRAVSLLLGLGLLAGLAFFKRRQATQN